MDDDTVPLVLGIEASTSTPEAASGAAPGALLSVIGKSDRFSAVRQRQSAAVSHRAVGRCPTMTTGGMDTTHVWSRAQLAIAERETD